MLAGIFLVNGRLSGSLNKWGVFCGLMSAVTYSFMIMFNKKAETVTGLENTMIQLAAAFFTVAVFVEIKTGYHISVGSENLVWIIVLGLLNTGIGCYLYFSGVSSLPVQTVAICGYLEPLSAILFAALILGERMSAVQLVGGVLIVGGAIFGEMKKRQTIDK